MTSIDAKKFVCHALKDSKRMQAYVGRWNPKIPSGILGSNGKYGNHIPINKSATNADAERTRVCQEYEKWILSDTEPVAVALREDMKKNLKGKILGCWCSPLKCHAETIAIIANS